MISRRGILILFVMALVPLLCSCNDSKNASESRRISGVYLDQSYEGVINIAERVRYIFNSEKSVNIYRLLLVGDNIINIDGTPRKFYLNVYDTHQEGNGIPKGALTGDGLEKLLIKPVFVYKNGYGNETNWYSETDISPYLIAKEGDWYQILKDAPVLFDKNTI